MTNNTRDEGSFFAVIVVSCVCAITFFVARALWRCIVIVPSWHFAATVRYGKVKKILRTGLHIVHPFDSLLEIQTLKKGSFLRPNELVQTTMTMFPLRPTELDPPPVAVTTKDGVIVTVDATLWWKIHEPSSVEVEKGKRFEFLAIGRDPIGVILERYKQYAVDALRHMTLEEIQRVQWSDVATKIKERFAEMVGCDYPIDVEEVVVQSLKLPQEFIAASQKFALEQKAALSRKIAAQAELEAEKVNRDTAIARENARTETVEIAARGEASSLAAMLDVFRKNEVPQTLWADLIEARGRSRMYDKCDGSKITYIVSPHGLGLDQMGLLNAARIVEGGIAK